MRIHQLSALDAVASLKSTADGLSRAEVERRLHEYGRNGVEEVARRPLWLRFVKEFITFFSLILWIAAGLAFFADWSDPGQDMAKVGYAIVTVILVSGLFSFWQEYRVEQTLAALRKLLPQQAQVLREGKVTRVPAEELVPGDIVHLEPGDNIPADCRLIEAFGVRVNNAAVTGESLPKAREADCIHSGRLDRQQERRARRHVDGVRAGQGRRLRHGHAHRDSARSRISRKRLRRRSHHCARRSHT